MLPRVGPERPLRLPAVTASALRNGLRVVVARRPSVPRVEARLLVPAGTAADARRAGVRAWLLAETLTTGTAGKTSYEIAAGLQAMGGELAARAADDFLWLSGGVLSANLGRFLELMAEVALGPTMPPDEVEVARSQLLQRLVEQRAEPGFIAGEELFRRMLGSHPYALLAPPVRGVEAARRDAVVRFHREAFTPAGATLVLVGDLRPQRALEAARTAFGGWRRRAAPPPVRPPSNARWKPTLVVHRPGAVQTNIRLGGTVPGRSDPAYFPALVANTIFGGYFSSRLVENIRERKGYTYGPGSGFAEHRAANFLAVRADVRNQVTAAALTEIRYELGRMCALEVEPAELESARRYLLGLQALALQSQQGLAAQLTALEALGVGPEFLRTYRDSLARVTAADVLGAARRFLSPRALTTVLVGDAEAVARDVGALEPVEVVRRRAARSR